MADLLDFQITPLAAVSVSVPRAQIAGRFVDSDTQQTTIADFTGANALIFPAVITTLTAAQRLALARMIAVWLLRVKAGLDDGTHV